jgi:hypothetical protein
VKSDRINNSDEILRKYIDLDDDTIESLKRHYKLEEDSGSDDLLKYVKGNRKVIPEDSFDHSEISNVQNEH